MFPTIPENLEALSADELLALREEIRVAVLAFRDGEEQTTEDIQTATDLVRLRSKLQILAEQKRALAEADLDEDAPEETLAEEVAEEAEAEVEETTEDAVEEALADSGEETISEDTTEVEASVNTPKVHTGTGVATQEDRGSTGFTPDKLIAKGGVSSLTQGSAIDSWGDLSEALMEVAAGISPGSSTKIPVASVLGKFDESQILGERMVDNLRKFEPEVMAQLCAPAEPVYDLDCWNTDRRPVRSSLASFLPNARGQVSIYPSPSLTDITDQAPNGTGIWTTDDDASLSGTDPSSKDCAVINCASPTVYKLYGVWRCLTIQNLMAMTFPELVEAYLNRLAAAHARLAETQLLEAMGTGTVAVNASDLGYGSTTSVTTSVMTLLALHQEAERWDNGPMDAWLPRWVMTAMKVDLLRRRNDSGKPTQVSDGEIERLFRDSGVEPNWFIDTPSWATAIPAVQTAGALNQLPNSVEMIIAPRGKFAVMDRGELSIGVTGNNIYRDNQSNASNQFTMFFENFEAIVDTNSCPAYTLTVDNLCHNGVQIADAELDCLGETVGT